ncbi:MAG TPA: hypothetical protein VFS43_32950 [Polyangiaceae bacterium]|nr:hypothetical protein [Polyangiaceae bacterium]
MLVERTFSSAKGSLKITIHSPHLFESKAAGSFEFSFAYAMRQALDDWYALAGHSLRSFNDWENMTNYDLGARALLTEWVYRHRKSIVGTNFLLGSHLVGLGVKLASYAVGDAFVMYPDRSSFLIALDMARTEERARELRVAERPAGP